MGAMLAIIADPENHYHSLAPPSSSGALFDAGLSTSEERNPGDFASYWASPQSRALLYVYMSAGIFSVVIEALMLYAARFRLRDPYGAQVITQCVLVSFFVFDLLHAGGVLGVAGWERVWGAQTDFYAAINVWVPVSWMVIRGLWLFGIGRDVVLDDGCDKKVTTARQPDTEKRQQ